MHRRPLISLLVGYAEAWPAERNLAARFLTFVGTHPDCLLRTCAPGHITASAWIEAADRSACLLTHHRKLGRWLQLGGHCDGDANLARVALREAVEESGIGDLAIDPLPVDLDVHVIPARGSEPEHLHLDTRFLIHAPTDARATASEESLELRWFAPEGLATIETDDSVRRLCRIAFKAAR